MTLTRTTFRRHRKSCWPDPRPVLLARLDVNKAEIVAARQREDDESAKVLSIERQMIRHLMKKWCECGKPKQVGSDRCTNCNGHRHGGKPVGKL